MTLPGRIYGYARVSTDRQEHSLGNQFHEIAKEVATAESLQGLQFKGIFHDEEVSGGTPWFNRPGGVFLSSGLREGDTVVATYIDRVFRNQADAANIAETLYQRGVNLHFIHFEIRDINSPIGRAIFHIMTAFAQMEKDLRRERQEKATEERMRRNRPICHTPSMGWKIVTVDGVKRLAPDYETREMVAIMAELRKEHHWNWTTLAKHMWVHHQFGSRSRRTKRRPNPPMDKPLAATQVGKLLERHALDWPKYPTKCDEITLRSGRHYEPKGIKLSKKMREKLMREQGTIEVEDAEFEKVYLKADEL